MTTIRLPSALALAPSHGDSGYAVALSVRVCSTAVRSVQ